MALLLPGLRVPVSLSGGIAERATSRAVRSLEDWLTELVRRLSVLEASTNSWGFIITSSDVTGTTNRIAKFTGAHSVGDSSITDTGALVTVNNPLTVTGATTLQSTLNVTGAITGQSTLTLPLMTQGSVLFAGVGGLVSQDNAGLFWDNTNNQLRVTTSAAAQAVRAISSHGTSGTMSIQNTNVNGPADFFAIDNGGTARMSWGYGNASYVDTARAGRGYVWRDGVNFVFARTGVVDGTLFSNGNWRLGSTVTDPGVKLRVDGNLTVSSAEQTLLRVVGDNNNNGDASYTGLVIMRGTTPTELWFLGRDGGTPSDDFVIRRSATADVFRIATGTGKTTITRGASGAAAANANTVLELEHSTQGWLEIRGPAANSKGVLCSNPSASGDGALIYDSATFARGWAFNAANATAMSIASTGNVRIGSTLTDPGVKLQVDGALTATGTCTLGDSTSADTHIVNGKLTGTTADQTMGLQWNHTATALASSGTGFQSLTSGTYNATAAGRNVVAVWADSSATRSSGANAVTNFALYGSADGGQANYALYTALGDVRLNDSGGVTTIQGATTINNSLTVTGNLVANGNVTLTDAATETVGIVGHLGVGQAADGNAQIIISQVAASQYGIYHVDAPSGSTEDRLGIQLAMQGTYDCTAAARIAYGIAGAATASRSAGANNLTNYAIYADAANGQVNYSFFGNRGTLRNLGDARIDGNFEANGNATLCNAAGDTLKFHGGTGATQQTVTGSRGGNAALADLLTKLATLGLIVDGTTA
jgi:hypothetical protein